MVGCLLLDRVFALHVELLCHLVAVVGPQIVVERLVVARNAASDAGGVGCEDRGYLGHELLDHQGGGGRLPLVGVEHDTLVVQAVVAVETLHHLGGGPTEEDGVVVVAKGVEAVHAKLLPEAAVEGVFLVEKRAPIDQNGYGAARDRPASYAHVQTLAAGHVLPFGEEALLLEVGARAVLPAVWPDENQLVVDPVLERPRPGGKHGVDAAHLIADLPTGLEDIVGE